MLLQCAAMVAKKLPVGDKITASVRQICLLVVVWKVLNRKTLSSETFCFIEKRYFAINVYILCSAHNQRSWNVLLFLCNLSGQLCRPGYSSRTVIGIFLSEVSSVIGNNYGPRGVLNIYMRKLEIPVGKSNGARYSVWEAFRKYRLCFEVMQLIYSFQYIHLIWIYFVARSKAVYAQDLLCVLKPFLFMHKISTRVTKW